MPYVNFNRDNRQVKLNANWYDNGNDNLAVPVFREFSSKARSASRRSFCYPTDFIQPPSILPAS